jgi:hypothetical protein
MAARAPAERRLIEGTLGGLRFVRNRMGYYVDHSDFIGPQPNPSGSADDCITEWSWRSLPEPVVGSLPPRGQAWEMARYRAYEARLAGQRLGEVFERAAAFLKLAAAHAAQAGTADTQTALTRGAGHTLVVRNSSVPRRPP